RCAIELKPNLSNAHLLLAASLLQQGRLSEAIVEWQKTHELDPLSAKTARMLAYSHLLNREYPEATEILQRSYDLGPPFTIWGEIEFYLQNGNPGDALVELEKAKRERKDDPLLITSEGMVYAAQGKRTEALRIIEQLERMPGVGPAKASWIARIYATMNDKEQALGWLERGVEAGAIPHFFKDAPVWDTLRDE